MNLFRKIRLSLRYGLPVYVMSVLLDLSLAAAVMLSKYMLEFTLPIKLMSIPVICYLHSQFSDKQSIYFYINLGISRTETYSIPLIVDFLLFLFLMTVSTFATYAIH